MRFHKDQLLIYAVTDRAWTKGRSLCGQVEEALKGGATMVQFREKGLGRGNYDQMLAEAMELRELTGRFHVPLIIDDNIELALACGADGLHVGQDDMDAGLARRLLGPDRILGVTAKTVEQARKACAQGADYLGSGAVFGTTTKSDARPMTIKTLRAICDCSDIPVVAIGGINLGNIGLLEGSHVAGAAIVSGIFAAQDICLTTGRLKEAMIKICSSSRNFQKTVDN